MKKALFGNNINPACEYCELGKKTKDGKMVLCEKTRCLSLLIILAENSKYDPLLRIPKRMPRPQKMTDEDFKI